MGKRLRFSRTWGVIAGIVFLALEVRQNTNATVSTAVEAIPEGSMQINSMLVENEDLRLAYVDSRAEGLESLSEYQRVQLSAYFLALVRNQQNRYQPIRLGIVEDEDIYSLEVETSSAYSHPFFIDYRESTLQSRFSEDFVEWFEARRMMRAAE